MEHPPKQGLKLLGHEKAIQGEAGVLMEHPPKQGLKPGKNFFPSIVIGRVLMEHPPKQGLKHLSRAMEHMKKYVF